MSASVFPARAGMSPPRAGSRYPRRRVPRASGDEPEITFKYSNEACVPRASGDEPMTTTTWHDLYECSPRERG